MVVVVVVAGVVVAGAVRPGQSLHLVLLFVRGNGSGNAEDSGGGRYLRER